jgi:regulator of sirC expression with transglutaminase-like and TPR domain
VTSQTFHEIVSGETFSLADAFLAFAGAAYPALESAPYAERLDALARSADAYVSAATDPAERLAAIGAHLASHGLRGNTEEYYDPRNSFLNEVLDRGLGIPISLSVVWIEVCARAGVDVVGVGMPMHFIVGLRGARVFADPFNAGRLLSVDEAVALFGTATDGRVPWDDAYLDPTPRRDIVRRALNNLKAIYGTAGDMRSALWVEDHLLAIPGVEPGERKERASVQAALGQYPEAIADLRAYLESGPEDADEVEAEIRRLVATMN